MSDYQVRYFEFGDFRLDTAERVLLRKDERIPLTHRSYQLLLTLIQNKGHLLRHEELIQLVWNETAVDHANLKQNIALIRKALGDGNMDSQFIQTVPKFGYRFVAPVNLLPDENIALITERKSVMQIDFEEELSDEKSLVRTKRENFSGRSFYKIAITGLFVFIFILIPIWFFTRQNPVNKPNNFSIENITPRKLTDSGNVELGALSPNGEFAVYTTLDMEKESILWLRQIDSRDSIKLVSLTAPERIGAFSITNDGKWIYFVSIKNGDWGKQASLFKVSILGGKTQKITDYIDSFVSFSPDDSSFVFNRFTENGCQLITANALDGSNEKIIAQGKTNLEFLEPKWSPDGSEILFFSVEHQSEGNFSNLSTISVETGKVE
nr:winged helix-turn-helix domain-containing protein [Pyrinomonadaceae bacterium]